MNHKTTYCGYISILGRPNVGKSTLVNRILGEKVSITSRKPQTTRHRILGIHTVANKQALLLDTPGLHLNAKHEINKAMIKTAQQSMIDVDALVFVIDARYWTKEDDYVLQLMQKMNCKLIIAVNKIDKVKDKDTLLPLLQELHEKFQQAGCMNFELVPISAKTGHNVPELEKLIMQQLPQGPFFFPEDQITDRGMRFMAAELIREKLMRYLGEEVPHKLAVEIEQYKYDGNLLRVSALIWVESKGQKKIVIGAKGERLKEIGRLARIDIENITEHKVFLQLWVKVKSGWTDDLRAITSLGYKEE